MGEERDGFERLGASGFECARRGSMNIMGFRKIIVGEVVVYASVGCGWG